MKPPRPKHIRYVSLALAVLLAMPLPLGILTGFHLWLSPLYGLCGILALGSVVALHAVGLLAWILTGFKHKWICRYVCPTGALCDFVSEQSPRKFSLRHFPSIHLFLLLALLISSLVGVPLFVILDPFSLFFSTFDILHQPALPAILVKASGLCAVLTISFFFPHLWCTRLCPLGGLQAWTTKFRLWLSSRGKVGVANRTTRRIFMAATSGAVTGLLLRHAAASPHTAPLRPPGSLPERDYLLTCIRCGNCIKSCPEKIINPSVGEGRLLALFSPKLDFSNAYCVPECKACGDVCPTGAIHRFSSAEKKSLKIGLPSISLPDCLLQQNTECNKCIRVCDYEAIKLVESDYDFSYSPVVDEETCVGCGACEWICPTRAIRTESLLKNRPFNS
jgi:ferredoxin-type protein NapF